MGFPFDRPISDSPEDLTGFASNYDNMIAKQITIRHFSEYIAQVGDNPLDIDHL